MLNINYCVFWNLDICSDFKPEVNRDNVPSARVYVELKSNINLFMLVFIKLLSGRYKMDSVPQG